MTRKFIVPKHKRFLAALVDCDNTLVRTEPRFKLTYADVCAENGFDFHDYDYRLTVGRPADRTCAALVAHFGLPAGDATRWYERFRHLLYSRHFDRLEFMPGTETFLDTVAAHRLPCVIVSNATDAHVAAVQLSLPRLAGLRAVTRDHPRVGHDVKPHPAPFEIAAEELGVDIRQCAALGDTEIDMRSARAAGAFAFGIPHEFSGADDLASADKLLRNIGAFDPTRIPARRRRH